jgi:(2Fe-2S) ferredoxin
MTYDKQQVSDPELYFEAHVFVCCNRRPDGHARGSCAAAGSERLRDYMKARVKELGLSKIRINTAMCLDRCEMGPSLVVYPEGIWYKIESFDDVDQILAEHIIAKGRANSLMIDQR